MNEPRSGKAVLGPNRYGKAEVRLVHIDRSRAEHTLHDLTVSISLGGDLTASHLTGDNANVLPTDSQKNTVYAFARDGIASPEAFALRLARHFVDTQGAIDTAYVGVESVRWERLPAGGRSAGHSFRRDGSETRTVRVEHSATETLLVSGVRDLVVLNTTNSEFSDFATDEFTTLAPTSDRVLATAINARWRWSCHGTPPGEWDTQYVGVRDRLLATFADTYSYALQQTLFAMGAQVIETFPQVDEVRLTLPNRHHFLVDLTPFGLDNPNAVYHAADRPYGLIEGTVLRAGAVADPRAW